MYLNDFEKDMHNSLSDPYGSVPFLRRYEEEKQEASLSWTESLDAAWTGAKHGIATYAPERFYRSFRALGRMTGSQGLEDWATAQIQEELAARENDPWYRPDEKWMQTEWGRSLYEGFSNFTSSTVTMLPGAALALGAAPLTGGLSLGAAFAVGAASSGGLSGLSEFDTFLDEAYQQIQTVDPSVTKDQIYNDKFWGAVVSGVAEGGMSFTADLFAGKLAGVLGKPAAKAASGVVSKFIKNLTSHMAVELGEESATAYVQDWAREVNGMDYQGRWNAIKNIIGPTLVAGGLGGLQNTALSVVRDRGQTQTQTFDEATQDMIGKFTAARQREALSEAAYGFARQLTEGGMENGSAFQSALVADALANRWGMQTGRDASEFFNTGINQDIAALAEAVGDGGRSFDGVVDSGMSFLWNSLPPEIRQSLEQAYTSPTQPFDLAALGNDLKSWIKEGDAAVDSALLTDENRQGFAAMRDILVDSVDALGQQSTMKVSNDTLAVLDKAIDQSSRQAIAAPAVVRDEAAMSEVLSRHADTGPLTAEQQTAMLADAAKTVRVDLLADGAPQDVKGMFSQYAKALEPVLARLRENQKTRKDHKVEAEARKMFEGNPGIAEIVDTFDANLGMDAKVAMVEMIITAADENVAALSRRALETGSPEEQLQARMLAERVVAMQQVSKNIGTEQGRAFRMRRFNRKDSRFSEQLMAGLSAYGGQNANEAFLTAMSNAANRTERMKIAEVGVGRRTQDAVVEGVTAGMLFGPSTHIVNAFSNAIQGVNEVATRAYAGMLGGKVEGGVLRGEAQAMLLGIWPAFGEIRRIWREHRSNHQNGVMGTLQALGDGDGMWKNANNTIAEDTGHMGRAISRETAEQAIGQGKAWLGMSKEHGRVTQGLATGVEYLGRFLSLPYTMLLHSDQIFKTVFKSMELNAQIHRAAQGNAAEAARMHKSPPTDLVRKAEEFARRATFQDPLGKVGSNINAIRNEMPLTRLLLPFLKTPVNIYLEGARMTPFLNKAFKSIRAEQNSPDPAVRQLAEAKLMVGSMVWGSAMVAAGMGLLTGPGPEDPAEKQRKLATGWRPNALVINGDHYQIDRLDPLAAVFNSAAFIVELRDHLQVDDLETAMMMGVGQSLRLLTNRTYIESFSDAMQLLTNFERAAPIMQRRLGGMIVPASALGRTAVRSTDPWQHEVDSFWSAIKSNIPGLSSSLPVRRDFLGQPMEGLEYAGTNWLSPFQVGRNRDDEVYQEVARLQQAGFSAAPIPNRRLTVQGQNYKMNGEEYSRFLDLYGNEIKINGLSAKQALDKLVASPRYGLMYDEERAEAIKATLTVYGKQARKRMVEGDDKIRNALNVRNKGMNFFFGLN